jgi:hypothetical protein
VAHWANLNSMKWMLRPWSQQDIVAEAVSQWLRKHASK